MEKIVLSSERIKELVEMQDVLNKATAGDDWAEKGYNWRLYSIMEAAEAIESLPYKHWKKGEVDLENVKVETVDVFHFMFSHILVEYERDDIIEVITLGMNEANKITVGVNDTQSILNALQELIRLLANEEDENEGYIFMYLFLIWKILGETPESLYKAYMIKNNLNGFRQLNGYKEGTYKKLWNLNGEVVEDNVVAYHIAAPLEVSDTFVTNLRQALAVAYVA